MIVTLTLKDLARKLKESPREEELQKELLARLKKLDQDLKLAALRKDALEVHKLSRTRAEVKYILGPVYGQLTKAKKGGE